MKTSTLSHAVFSSRYTIFLLLLLITPWPAALLAQTTPELDTVLFTNDSERRDRFGTAMEVSGDVMIVGAPSDPVLDDRAVNAYIFRKNGDKWIQEATLSPSQGAARARDRFGTAVSISGDVAIVGAPIKDRKGAVYIFRHSGGTWTEEALLTITSSNALWNFGVSVSISGDVAVVAENHLFGILGSAYVFRYDGSTWTQEARLTSSDPDAPDDFSEGDFFGNRVAVSGDVALVTAPGKDDKGRNSGAVYAFRHSDGTWTEEAKLTASDGAAGDQLGRFAMSFTDDVAIIGAWLADGSAGEEDPGAAYIFRHSDGTWTEEAKLTASDAEARDWFGTAATIAGDVALVRATLESERCDSCSAVYLFRKTGDTWAQDAKLLQTDPSQRESFGRSLALSGSQAFIGAPDLDFVPPLVPNSVYNKGGGVYVYTIGPENTPPIADAGADQKVIAGQSVSLDGSASSDPDGDALTYVWLLEGPGSPALSNATTSGPTFCAIETGTFTASLIVNDGIEDSDPDEVVVTAITPRAALASLANRVEEIGTLNKGQTNALVRKLEQTQRLLDRGKTAEATDVLAGYQQQLADFIAGSVLTAEEATALTASDILAVLTTPCGTSVRPVDVTGKSLSNHMDEIPTTIELGVYPNPFNPQTTIRYGLSEAGEVRLAIYDVMGREVTVLVSGEMQRAGWHEVRFDASWLSSGIYLYRLQTAGKVVTGQMTLLK